MNPETMSEITVREFIEKVNFVASDPLTENVLDTIVPSGHQVVLSKDGTSVSFIALDKIRWLAPMPEKNETSVAYNASLLSRIERWMAPENTHWCDWNGWVPNVQS